MPSLTLGNDKAVLGWYRDATCEPPSDRRGAGARPALCARSTRRKLVGVVRMPTRRLGRRCSR